MVMFIVSTHDNRQVRYARKHNKKTRNFILCLFRVLKKAGYIYFFFSISIAMAENVFWKCESIYDVLQSKDLNSYRVLSKKYFYEPCINKNSLCPKRSYVVESDIVLVGKISNAKATSDHWCAAYIPSSYLLPRAIGWFEDREGLQPIDKDQYQAIIGEWRAISSQNDYWKNLSINMFPEENAISIYGQSLSRNARNGEVGHIIDGIILMTEKNRYISIANTVDGNDNECVSDIDFIDGKLYLNTRSSCGITNNYSDFSDYYAKYLTK